MENEMPLSETMLYILFSLRETRHGYGIMLYVKELTHGRMVLGAGTIYQTLMKLEKKKWIRLVREDDRKRFYRITEDGTAVLESEIRRIRDIYQTMEEVLK